MSPGYPMIDQRFARLMQENGRERHFIRLSPFRRLVESSWPRDKNGSRLQVDRFLYGLGRKIFHSAWHEDQRMAVAVAATLQLPNFKDCIEFLYLILGGIMWATGFYGKKRSFTEEDKSRKGGRS